jgi:cellulose synthase/poly-beta-1,6-N-acetylglucosamine synthase-like glycosyltransferase
MLRASVGVCAYNEEKNILACLESLVSQRLDGFVLGEIFIVSSGSTDGTDRFVNEFASTDSRVRLLRQERREGKNSAVNFFISQAQGEILVLANADNRLGTGALQKLLDPFLDEKVGMAGGHPVPVNSKETFTGFAVHMLWDMHHRVSLLYPKTGELVAFRNLGIQLPAGTQSDEDTMRMELERRGYCTAYAPEAIVFNKGPMHIGDYFKQRTRVDIGEMYLKRWHNYSLPTWDTKTLLSALTGFAKENRRHLGKMTVAIGLEYGARIYARLYVALDRGDKAVWLPVASSKDLDQAEK